MHLGYPVDHLDHSDRLVPVHLDYLVVLDFLADPMDPTGLGDPTVLGYLVDHLDLVDRSVLERLVDQIR
jgi:hypothetical protein